MARNSSANSKKPNKTISNIAPFTAPPFRFKSKRKKGEWNFKLRSVFCVGILDFTFDDYTTQPEKSQVLRQIKLKDQNNKIFYDKLTYIYLEMPNFRKTEDQLETQLDKWLYFIKNLEDFSEMPHIFGDEMIFQSAFEKAEFARLMPEDQSCYQHSLKIYRDIKNVIDTAYDEGKIEGKAEGKVEMTRVMKHEGLDLQMISKITGLSISEISML